MTWRLSWEKGFSTRSTSTLSTGSTTQGRSATWQNNSHQCNQHVQQWWTQTKQWTWCKQQSSDWVEPNAFYPKKNLSSTHSAKVLHLGSTLVTVQGPAWKASAFPRETWTWKSWKMVPLLYVCWQNRQLSTWVTAKPSVLANMTFFNQRNCYKPRWGGKSMGSDSQSWKPEGPNFPEMLYVSCQGLPMTPWLCWFQMVALPNGLVADMCLSMI